MKTPVLVLFVCVLALFSCKSDPIDGSLGDQPPITKSFICDYLLSIDSVRYEEGESMAYFTLRGELISTSFVSQEKEPYWEYACLFGDTCYNDVTPWPNIFPAEILPALACDTIQTIHLFCEDDFNDTYPKGSCLDEVMEVHYYSFDQILDTGYENIEINRTATLDAFNREGDKRLLGSKFNLSFNASPSESGSHSFRIRFETTAGQVVEKIISFGAF